jgi:hypothetical protein
LSLERPATTVSFRGTRNLGSFARTFAPKRDSSLALGMTPLTHNALTLDP